MAVGVFSTARRRRNQEVSEIRRALRSGVSAEIEDDQAESAGLDDQIGGFERALGIAGAADPEQAVEADAGMRRQWRDRRSRRYR